jgi:hypothetical protein
MYLLTTNNTPYVENKIPIEHVQTKYKIKNLFLTNKFYLFSLDEKDYGEPIKIKGIVCEKNTIFCLSNNFAVNVTAAWL